MGPLILRTQLEQWPLITPFRITGHVWEVLDVLVVTLEMDGCVGRGEASGVYYRNDTPTNMIRQVENVRTFVEEGISRKELQQLLPPGGARNAVDCALWDLEAKLERQPVWKLAGLGPPKPVLTTLTCGADTPEKMAATALGYAQARAIKLKLTGEPMDADRVTAVRAVRPDVWLGVDANQGFTRPMLERLMPVLKQGRVSLIEQPFRIGQEALLDGFESPIPIAADESAPTLVSLPDLVGRFSAVNIKLDKCGGLTEALEMARVARELDLAPLVGNMIGTSLGMAPAILPGQFCSVVDLDGPLFLKEDRPITVRYAEGCISSPEALWGGADGASAS
jgi:L-alanine-DL-glutamate epimerase-like enolase superfamily enzyme